MRRWICILLAALMMLSVTAVAAANDDVGQDSTIETVNTRDSATEAPGSEQPNTEETAATAETQTEYETEIVQQVTIPEIVRFTPANGGVKIEFSAYKNAPKYRVFYRYNNSSWKRAGDTATLSLTKTGLTDGVTYTFTVRAMNASGAYISKYNTKGWAYTFRLPPVLTSAASVKKGIKTAWKSVKGASYYRVYSKENSAWKVVANTTSLNYTDTAVTSGKKYTYTVRAVAQDGTNLTYFDRAGISATFVAAPVITKVENTADGQKITWKTFAGTSVCRVFYKSGTSWKKLGDSATASITRKGLKDGANYTYTVRAMNTKKQYVSGYDTAGVSARYYAPLSYSVAGSASGATIKWKAAAGTSATRVYRKVFGESWLKLADTDALSYTDAAYPKDTLVSYMARRLNDAGKVVSYYKDSGLYYYNGVLANGKITAGGSTYTFRDGKQAQGFVTLNGKTYYYNSKGEIVKNGLVGSKSEGYGVADKNGVVDLNFTGIAKNSKGYWYLKKGKLDTSYRNGVTYGGSDWNVLNGKATKVSTAAQRTLFRALKIVYKNTDSSMTKAQKLRTMFNYVRTHYGECSPRRPHYRGLDWPVVYANDMFVNGKGNCFSYAASFAYLAKAIGYENVYCCNSGGHGWAEVDGLVYDPEWSLHNSKYSYFGLSYDARTDVAYRKAISAGEPFMHVKI